MSDIAQAMSREHQLDNIPADWDRPTLELVYRPSFGCDRFYPVCDRSKVLTQIFGIKSFTPYQLKQLSAEFELTGFNTRDFDLE